MESTQFSRTLSWIGALAVGSLAGVAVYIFLIQKISFIIAYVIVYTTVAKFLLRYPELVYGSPTSKRTAVWSGLFIAFLIFGSLSSTVVLLQEQIELQTSIAIFVFGAMVAAFGFGIEYNRSARLDS